MDERLPANTFTLLGKTGLASQPTTESEKSDGGNPQAADRAGLFSVPEEIGPENLPQEGGLENGSVDFQKGCYLGQETMARIHATEKFACKPGQSHGMQTKPLPCRAQSCRGQTGGHA